MGKTPLKSAKVICLLEFHNQDEITELNSEVIDATANKGDFVLLDGSPAGAWYSREKTKQTQRVKKEVKVAGCDSTELYKRAIELGTQHNSIRERLDTENLSDDNRNKLSRQLVEVRKQYDDTFIERNKVFMNYASFVKENHLPEGGKIYMILGKTHAEDPSFQRYLEEEQGIILEPTVTFSAEERKQMRRDYTQFSLSDSYQKVSSHLEQQPQGGQSSG